jgi:glycosyltransferase involved in cell wall biosynthesis
MKPSISVIIPLIERAEAISTMHQRYYDCLASAGLSNFEFIYVVVPAYTQLINCLRDFQRNGQPVTIVELNRDFGEAAAIGVGVGKAKYDQILTLPPYEQVPCDMIPTLFDQQGEYDVIVVRRWPRIEQGIKKLQHNVLNKLLSRITDAPFGDIGSGIRLCQKDVFDEITLYGDFHRFLPMLAYEQGFSIKVVDIPQSTEDTKKSIQSPRNYISRLLDIITVIFLTKFNKRPLRFFGAIGSVTLITGFLGLAWIGIERIFMGVAAAERPAMLLFVLSAVLGVQLLAIGLVGETLIFTHAKDIKEYKVKQIHEAH